MSEQHSEAIGILKHQLVNVGYRGSFDGPASEQIERHLEAIRRLEEEAREEERLRERLRAAIVALGGDPDEDG